MQVQGLQQHRGSALGTARRGSAASWRKRGPGRWGHRVSAAGAKTIWLQTSNKDAFQAGLESGAVSAFVFGPDPEQLALAGAWAGAARFQALLLDERGTLRAARGGGTGAVVGEVVRVDGPEGSRALEARVQALAVAAAAGLAGGGGSAGGEGGGEAEEGPALVVDARDWKIIPAENLVALAQRAPHAAAAAGEGGRGGGPAAPPLRLLATAGDAGEARLMLEALQAGTSGVLLRSEDPGEVRALSRYVERRAAEESAGASSGGLRYQAALVTAVRPLGMGDRACVDLACLLQPGEGLLVGSFARCLALVHSECDESDYIASRPFRVNAGPVHSYVAAPGGRTRYLSELASGAEVLVADAGGRIRTAMVGRVKIERRPLVLVELQTQPDGRRHSLMLQNAETVKLMGPVAGEDGEGKEQQQPGNGVGDAATTAAGMGAADNAAAAGAAAGAPVEGTSAAAPGAGAPGPARDRPSSGGNGGRSGGGGRGSAAGGRGWRTISVSALQPGDRVFVLLQAAARHTGIAIEEFIVEK
ncbi:3-dehydroquinate synthase [Tetrabaena socialis]|uniref:3-dehydroquinate synthase n=1 Tax=Tetrabaena socialis TaxID=47790 RepID=A0A2J8A4V5_9CHLO|nr:3-dehydroquinate synthase [Tetrabaena socialis]|eukprot:PNH07549.1 3-dehydroquinate synthase [Tetrabaena socialis]